MQDIDQRQLDEVEEIAGIVHDEKGEDVGVVEPGSKEDKDAVEDVADLPHVYQQGKPKMVSSTGTILERWSNLMLVGDPIQSVKMDLER